MKAAVDAYFRKNRWMPENMDNREIYSGRLSLRGRRKLFSITMDEAENYFGYDSKDPNSNEEEVENELL